MHADGSLNTWGFISYLQKEFIWALLLTDKPFSNTVQFSPKWLVGMAGG